MYNLSVCVGIMLANNNMLAPNIDLGGTFVTNSIVNSKVTVSCVMFYL